MKDEKIAQTVVELPEFITQAEKCMSPESKDEFIQYIACNPLAGKVIEGTGGARKVRWASVGHKGKSGGARVVYYYHNIQIPIFLFTVFKKNNQGNITKKECNLLKQIIKQTAALYE